MSKRIARKRAMWRGLKFPEPILKRGLYENTGSLGMAYGLWKPRLYVDPRLLGEHRVLREFVTNHEGAHIALGHTRLLAVAKWAGILAVAVTVGTLLALSTRAVWVAPLGALSAAWVEARLGLSTIRLRSACEQEADAFAASVMTPRMFAMAIKTMHSIHRPVGRYAEWADRVVYGDGYRGRLARCGMVEVES